MLWRSDFFPCSDDLTLRRGLYEGDGNEKSEESAHRRWTGSNGCRHGPGGHSVFTYYLINGLTTGAADLNGDGIITSSEIEAYVAPRVTAETNSSQTPEYGILGGDMGGDFIFLPSNAVMSDMASATFGSKS